MDISVDAKSGAGSNTLFEAELAANLSWGQKLLDKNFTIHGNLGITNPVVAVIKTINFSFSSYLNIKLWVFEWYVRLSNYDVTLIVHEYLGSWAFQIMTLLWRRYTFENLNKSVFGFLVLIFWFGRHAPVKHIYGLRRKGKVG